MADIIKTYTIASAWVPELVDVFGDGWDATMPQTKAQFASDNFDECVRAAIKRRVRLYREHVAAQSITDDFGIA